MTWRPIGAFVMPIVDMRFVLKGRIANANQPPHPHATMRPRDFLELMDPGRHYPDLDMPSENEPDPAA